MRFAREKYTSLDWSKQDCVLAEENKTTASMVHQWRKRLGKPRPKLWHKHRLDHRPNKIEKNFGHLDFVNKRDVDLAVEAGVSRERIRQARVYLGKPKSRFHKMGRAQMAMMK